MSTFKEKLEERWATHIDAEGPEGYRSDFMAGARAALAGELPRG